MMMPPGFSAVFMVGMAVLVGGELMVVDDSNWWESCKGPVCTVAENQAEGLARLRVLSNYIKETMTLMGSVIASLEEGMQEVGQGLHNLVGRRCHSRSHTALSALINHMNQSGEVIDHESLEVIDDNEDNWTSGSDITQESTSVWSSDDEVSGSSSTTHSTSHRPSSTTHGTYHSTSHRPSSTTHGTYHSTSRHPSSTSHSTHRHTTSSTSGTWRPVSQYPSSTSHTTTQHYGGSSEITSTSSRGQTPHSRPSSTLKKYQSESEEESAESESLYVAPALPKSVFRPEGRGRGRHGSEHGPGHGRGGGHGRGRGHGSGRGRGGGLDLGLGGILSLTVGSSDCKGVPVGSPHYVPGLDKWCKDNCQVGNCPSTHCICY